MTDYFPEQDYDPDSGEYTSDFDFDPTFTSRVDFASGIHADISTDEPDFDPLAEDIASTLQDLVDYGYFDIEGNRNPLGYPLLRYSDFDITSKSARGPFAATADVKRWLRETRLDGQVQPYYDDDNDDYWIDADTS